MQTCLEWRCARPIIVLLAFVCLGNQAAGAEERIVTVGVYENAPKIFTAEDGRPAGIFVDLIEHIAQDEGWKLRYVPGSWTEGLERLGKGEIDLMPDVAYTAEREQRFSFHKVPVLSSWSQVYAAKRSLIRSVVDLNGKRIAVLADSIQQETLGRITNGFGLDVTLVPAADYKTVFELVANGKADAAVANRFYGLQHARLVGLEDTAVLFDPRALHFAAPKGVPAGLLEAIDGRLSEMKNDSRSVYYVSLKRWTSEEVRFRVPAWLQFSGLAAGLILLISLVGSLVLRHQVNVRTRELKEINQEMEQRIVQRTAELAAAMEKAQTADRTKSAFLATMSHELRTPLNSIIGFTGIMLQGLAGPLNQEQRKQMGMVQNSSRHLLSLINDVLDICKIEAGQLDLLNTPFELKPSIEKVARLVQPMAEKKGIGLRLDVTDGLGTITGDQRRIEQVVLNLLGNAIKFTEQGSVSVSCHNDGEQVVLAFTDTGIGMRPEDIPTLFQPFRQIDTGLDRKREGTGLGLSICRRILDVMGGSIAVESRVGQGSTFTVRVPRKPKDPS